MADPLRDKSYAFALRIVRLSEYLNDKKKEYVLSKKILDSGVNIGLLIEEGKQGDDRLDLRKKYSIANKEAFKTNFLRRVSQRKSNNIVTRRLHRASENADLGHLDAPAI